MPTDPLLDRALHAIADPTRRRILQALKEGKKGVEGKVEPCLCAWRRGGARGALAADHFSPHGDSDQGWIGGGDETRAVALVSAK